MASKEALIVKSPVGGELRRKIEPRIEPPEPPKAEAGPALFGEKPAAREGSLVAAEKKLVDTFKTLAEGKPDKAAYEDALNDFVDALTDLPPLGTPEHEQEKKRRLLPVYIRALVAATAPADADNVFTEKIVEFLQEKFSRKHNLSKLPIGKWSPFSKFTRDLPGTVRDLRKHSRNTTKTQNTAMVFMEERAKRLAKSAR